jgi:hypothetical protein
MSESERLAAFRAARQGFHDAVQGMERFMLNLDPGRVQVLRNWLRAVVGDPLCDRALSPPLEGWPLAERICEHAEAVLTARTALGTTWLLLRPHEQSGFSLLPGLH